MPKPMIPTIAPATNSGLGVVACLANAESDPAKMIAPSTMKTRKRSRYQIAEMPMKMSGLDRYTVNVRSRTSPTPSGRSIGA